MTWTSLSRNGDVLHVDVLGHVMQVFNQMREPVLKRLERRVGLRRPDVLWRLRLRSASDHAGVLHVVDLRPGVIAGDGVNPGPERQQYDGPFWFAYVDPRDVAQAVERCLQPDPPKSGIYYIVAAREDTLFDWRSARDDLGHAPVNNWPEIPLATSNL